MATRRVARTGLVVATILGLIGCDRGAKSQAANPSATRPAAVGTAAPAGATPVNRGPDGTLGLAQPDGTPVDGVKLSQYDSAVSSPCVAVAPDGAIHVAFVEQQAASPYTVSVYHRSSSDGGKTWSDPKNLSADVMPGFNVGNCKLLIDGGGRVYVLWRTGLREGFPTSADPGGEAMSNIVYRVLDGGHWSKVLNAHPPGSPANQDDGSICFMAVIDAAGHPQVIYNVAPGRFHPKEAAVQQGPWLQPIPGIKNGLVFQSKLDGSTPPTPREWYMTKITIEPTNPTYGRYCDGFTYLDGSTDAAGQPHLLVRTVHRDDPSDQMDRMEILEAGKQTPTLKLPQTFKFDSSPPRLLVDAKGARHVVAINDAGERPAVRDYTLGSDDDPAYVFAASKPKGSIIGFQAFQGPGGKMAVIVEATKELFNDAGDSWLLTSDGSGKWSEPICLTNNGARAAWATKHTGALSDVSVGTHYGPGPGGLAFDKDGHILIALVNNKLGSFGLAAGGVVYASGSTSAPMLFFYRL